MSKSRHDSYSPISGIGFIEALTILFIAYKLAGLIAWSWLWVLSPLWITFSVLAVIAVIALAVDVIQDHFRDEDDSGSND